MRQLFFSLLAFVCALMMFASPRFIQEARGADDDGTQASELATVFWGIVAYTRWPDAKGVLRVCLSGDDRHLAMIRRSAIELKHRAITLFTPEKAASACDIVYVSGASADDVGKLSRSLNGAPVLTIGDGGEFCNMGGMFCLLPDGGGGGEKSIDGFAVNQEAISRSPLRVNPQVLRLSKRNQER
ncbi:MAG: YfiR family protein [Proteobacteria bacterium]|jgi:hypothetical protein|nr:YfiR family protein [Pseudomonadota bacterium]